MGRDANALLVLSWILRKCGSRVKDDHRPCVDSDPDLERRKACVLGLGIEGCLSTLHGNRARQRPPGVIGRLTGRAEDGHHRIAGELV